MDLCVKVVTLCQRASIHISIYYHLCCVAHVCYVYNYFFQAIHSVGKLYCGHNLDNAVNLCVLHPKLMTFFFSRRVERIYMYFHLLSARFPAMNSCYGMVVVEMAFALVCPMPLYAFVVSSLGGVTLCAQGFEGVA